RDQTHLPIFRVEIHDIEVVVRVAGQVHRTELWAGTLAYQVRHHILLAVIIGQQTHRVTRLRLGSQGAPLPPFVSYGPGWPGTCPPAILAISRCLPPLLRV